MTGTCIFVFVSHNNNNNNKNNKTELKFLDVIFFKFQFLEARYMIL